MGDSISGPAKYCKKEKLIKHALYLSFTIEVVFHYLLQRAKQFVEVKHSFIKLLYIVLRPFSFKRLDSGQ